MGGKMTIKKPPSNGFPASRGFSVLEVMVAVVVFGIAVSSIYRLISYSSRIRGRALFVESATRLASDEAERIRSIAARNMPVNDSSYTIDVNGRMFSIERTVEDTEDRPSFQAKAREPEKIALTVSPAENEKAAPVRFKFLIGNDTP